MSFNEEQPARTYVKYKPLTKKHNHECWNLRMAGTRKISAEPLRQDHNLSTGFVLLHAPVCLNDLVKVEDLANLSMERPGSDLLNEVLQRHPHEVFRFACIRCQADRSGYRVHRGKILERPFVPDDPGHAHDAALLNAPQRIFQCRCADQFEHLVDTVRTHFHDLFGD